MMKFAVIALGLGCASIACIFTQSTFVGRKVVHSIPLAEIGSIFDYPWTSLFTKRLGLLHNPPRSGNTLPTIPLLTKAEALSLIEGAAAKYRVPAEFVTSIVAAESDFDSTVVSNKGAIGLMQLMPETAREFGADACVPAENVDAGTHYLRWLMEHYQNSRGAIQRVIAAYNAGPGMVDRYRGVPPFRETRTYVARVLGFLRQFSRRGTNSRG